LFTLNYYFYKIINILKKLLENYLDLKYICNKIYLYWKNYLYSKNSCIQKLLVWKNLRNIKVMKSRWIDSLLCNLKRRIRIVYSTTFVIIMYCCALKYRSPLDIVTIFLIKTIMHWLPLYASRNCSLSILKLLLRIKMSCSNSPSPFTINNCLSPLLSLPPLTPTMMTTMVT
jgi:hypothetical protein